ncbi:MAG: cystathionine beta-lyase [Lautropia sp.]|nr:cystathionine beta-lyase [Lautropia sp.]
MDKSSVPTTEPNQPDAAEDQDAGCLIRIRRDPVQACKPVEAGRGISAPIKVVNPPVIRASTVTFDSVQEAIEAGRRTNRGERHQSTYATAGTETTYALMDAVAELEGGGHAVRAALMPSGLSAICTVMWAFTSPGDEVLMTDSVYGPTRTFADALLNRFGVKTRYFDPLASPDDLEKLVSNRTRMIYLESPGSYTFEIQDVPAISAWARDRGILSVIDNTYASPRLARPFDWGVDISIPALTKYWCGHADVLMGAAVVREALWPKLWETVRQTGVCVGGDDAWLILRGMRTLDARMQIHEQTALAVASWLERQQGVVRVLHPGLPSHPRHALFKRDFLGSNGLFSFEVEDVSEEAILALCNGRRHFSLGFSWGGFESLIMPADLRGIRTVSPWTGGMLVRIHCGLEGLDALITDLDEGLSALRAVG